MTDACKETKDINEKSEKSTPRETARANWYWPLKLFFKISFSIEKIIFMNSKVCALWLFKCRQSNNMCKMATTTSMLL